VREPAIGNSCEGCEILRALASLHTHKARGAGRALVIMRQILTQNRGTNDKLRAPAQCQEGHGETRTFVLHPAPQNSD